MKNTKRFIVSTIAVLSLFVAGCKTPAVTQAIVQTTVATGVALGIQKSPEAIPYLWAAAPIVCSAASGTNISPAVVVAAIEAANIDTLKTPEAVIIMNGALSLYFVLYDQYGIEAVNNQELLKAYLQGTCNGLNLGLAGKSRGTIPHIR